MTVEELIMKLQKLNKPSAIVQKTHYEYAQSEDGCDYEVERDIDYIRVVSTEKETIVLL